MDSIWSIITDGTRYPNVFAISGCIALALYIGVQIIRTWIKRKLLSELMSPIWAPVLTVVFLLGLMGIDHLRANGMA